MVDFLYWLVLLLGASPLVMIGYAFTLATADETVKGTEHGRYEDGYGTASYGSHYPSRDGR